MTQWIEAFVGDRFRCEPQRRHVVRRCIVLVMAPICAGCTYETSVAPGPAMDVPSSYDRKLPGNFAVNVDDSKMAGTFKVAGLVCGASSYAMDARSAFAQSVEVTIDRLVEHTDRIEPLPAATSPSPRSNDGVISVRGDELDVDVRVIPGLWTKEMQADVSMAATVLADGPHGRVLGETLTGTGHDRQPVSGGCGAGADVVGSATEKALHDLTRQLGEHLANSERLREAATEAADAVLSTPLAPPPGTAPLY